MPSGLLKEFLCDLSDSQDFFILPAGLTDVTANYQLFTNLIAYDNQFLKAVSGASQGTNGSFLTGDTQLVALDDIQVITADLVYP